MNFGTIAASLFLASAAVSAANAMPMANIKGSDAAAPVMVDYACGPGYRITIHGYCARYPRYAPPPRPRYSNSYYYGYAPPPPPPPSIGFYGGWGRRW